VPLVGPSPHLWAPEPAVFFENFRVSLKYTLLLITVCRIIISVMMDQRSAMERAVGMKERGETTTPNVEVVRMMGTRIVNGSIPREVRSELMAGVKADRLGRLKKDGLMPEVFFHPNSRYLAVDIQRKSALEGVRAIASVVATPADLRAEIERTGGDVLEVLLARQREQAP